MLTISMMNQTFTLVICTKDRRDDISKCMESLSQRLRESEPKAWDVLVVDNAASDGTGDVARGFQRDYPVPVSVIREDRLGLAIARNTSLREAKGGVVVFVDDDVTFHSGWIEAWEQAFSDPTVTAGGGPIHPVFPASVPSWFKEGLMEDGGASTSYYYFGDEGKEISPGGETGLPIGANMAVKRKEALEQGGFNEDLGWGKKRIPCEETEFFQRLWKSGAKVVYTPLPCVDHHLPEGRLNLEFVRQWHRGYGRASIMMRPNKSPVSWLLKFIEQGFNLLFFGLRLALPGGSRNFRAHRKQSQAIGRLAQMMGV